MNETGNWLVHDHRKYETALHECDLAAGAGEWKEAVRLFFEFADDFKLHMRIEDEVLYPMFIETVAGSRPDIDSLSEDHDAIARLLNDLAYIIKQRDYDHFEESLAPLYRAILEHDAYEEEVFSQLSDDALLKRRDEALQRLNAMKSSENPRTWNF